MSNIKSTKSTDDFSSQFGLKPFVPNQSNQNNLPQGSIPDVKENGWGEFLSQTPEMLMTGVGNLANRAGGAIDMVSRMGDAYSNSSQSLRSLGTDLKQFGEQTNANNRFKSELENFEWDDFTTADGWAKMPKYAIEGFLTSAPEMVATLPIGGAFGKGVGLSMTVGSKVFQKLGMAGVSKVMSNKIAQEIMMNIGTGLAQTTAVGFLEGGDTFNQAIEQGYTAEEAKEAALDVVSDNLLLTMVNAPQYAFLFKNRYPNLFKIANKVAPKTKYGKKAANLLEVGLQGTGEYLEETYQRASTDAAMENLNDGAYFTGEKQGAIKKFLDPDFHSQNDVGAEGVAGFATGVGMSLFGKAGRFAKKRFRKGSEQNNSSDIENPDSPETPNPPNGPNSGPGNDIEIGSSIIFQDGRKAVVTATSKHGITAVDSDGDIIQESYENVVPLNQQPIQAEVEEKQQRVIDYNNQKIQVVEDEETGQYSFEAQKKLNQKEASKMAKELSQRFPKLEFTTFDINENESDLFAESDWKVFAKPLDEGKQAEVKPKAKPQPKPLQTLPDAPATIEEAETIANGQVNPVNGNETVLTDEKAKQVVLKLFGGLYEDVVKSSPDVIYNSIPEIDDKQSKRVYDTIKADYEAEQNKLSSNPLFNDKEVDSAPTDTKSLADVYEVPLNQIGIDEKRFQNRSKLDETVLKNIVDKYDENQFDPIVIWNDPKDKKTYLLAGHHRLEGTKRTGRKGVKARYFSGTEAEAVEYAKRLSNSNRTMEKPQERAKIYRQDRVSGKSKAQIEREAKELEGKNAAQIIDLSYLNESGKAIQSLDQFDSTDENANKRKLADVSQYLGRSRKLFSQLTDSHENQLFDYLMENEVKSMGEFIDFVNEKVGRLDFDPTKPIPLNKSKSELEREYDKNLSELKDEVKKIQQQRKVRLDELSERQRIQLTDGVPTGEVDLTNNSEITKRLQKFDDDINSLQREIINLEKQKGTVKSAIKAQGGLFESLDEAKESLSEIGFSNEQIQTIEENETNVSTEIIEDDGERLQSETNSEQPRSDSGTKESSPRDSRQISKSKSERPEQLEIESGEFVHSKNGIVNYIVDQNDDEVINISYKHKKSDEDFTQKVSKDTDAFRGSATIEQLVEQTYSATVGGDVKNGSAAQSVKSKVIDESKPNSKKRASEILIEQRKEIESNPTDAQIEAGNYKKGHVNIQGLNITLENAKGSERSGIDNKGKRWSVTLQNDYGYFKGTEGKDGDHVDVFIGDNTESKTIYIVDQVNVSGSFDEHKVMLGFNSLDDAKKSYLSNYSKGWQGLGNITAVPVEDFKSWLENGKRKNEPFASIKPKAKPKFEESEDVKKTKDELSALFDEFNNEFGNNLNSGIDPNAIILSGKIIAKGAELGYKVFKDYVKFVLDAKGKPFLEKIFQNFKIAYVSHSMVDMNNEEDLNAIKRSKIEDYVQQSVKMTSSELNQLSTKKAFDILIEVAPSELKPVAEQARQVNEELEKMVLEMNGKPEAMPLIFPFRILSNYVVRTNSDTESHRITDLKNQIKEAQTYLNKNNNPEFINEQKRLISEHKSSKEKKAKELIQQAKINNDLRIKVKNENTEFLSKFSERDKLTALAMLVDGYTKSQIDDVESFRAKLAEIDGINIKLSRIKPVFDRNNKSLSSVLLSLDNADKDLFSLVGIEELRSHFQPKRRPSLYDILNNEATSDKPKDLNAQSNDNTRTGDSQSISRNEPSSIIKDEKGFQYERGRSGSLGNEGASQTNSKRSSAQSSLFGDFDTPITNREPGNNDISQKDQATESKKPVARDTDANGSSTSDAKGNDVERGRNESNNSTSRVSFQELIKVNREKQKKAESIKETNLMDESNIRETLPFLLTEQQDDVVKAENRFYSDKEQNPERAFGKAMLFTNGTGTGKTYTGLGIIKRFARLGKNNILIVVPTQPKVSDWSESGNDLLLDITPLKDTTDGGKGINVTTYANFRSNNELLKREFDLIVYDESHRIMESKKGDTSSTTDSHYLMANVSEFASFDRLTKVHPLWIRRGELIEGLNEFDTLPNEDYSKLSNVARKKAELLNNEYKIIQEKISKVEPELKKRAKDSYKNTKVVFLSATPFKALFNLRYANKALFNWGEETTYESASRGQSRVDAESRFFLDNFGSKFEWKFHRLQEKSKPDSDAIRMQEISFANSLIETGAMSGRMIESNRDYARYFPLIANENTEILNRAYNELFAFGEDAQFSELRDFASDVFKDYNYSTKLLESLRASLSIKRVADHIKIGRKVVVFHRRKQGDVSPPFESVLNIASSEAYSKLKEAQKAKMPDSSDAVVKAKKVLEQVTLFKQNHSDVLDYEQTLVYESAIEQFKKAFGNSVAFINGDVSQKGAKERAIKQFNDHNSDVSIIMVQEESGKEGISLHDTIGELNGGKQRVLMNLSLPVSSITSIQTEGRIFRIGNESDAIFEYPILGLDFEIAHFGQSFNKKLSTTENLAMGDNARDLLKSFAQGVANAEILSVDEVDGIGGKELDKRADDVRSAFDKAILYYNTNQKQKGRRDQRKGVDFFPTPEPLGQKMVEWLALKTGESALEPSAGKGAIAMWFPGSVKSTSIEPSYELYAKLIARSNSDDVKQDTFENLHIINKYHGIAMNPPFGQSGKTAMDHVVKATKHLHLGGRIVAIVPNGGAMQKRIDNWIKSDESAEFQVSKTINLPSITFEQAGTAINSQVLVIDKIGTKKQQESEFESLPKVSGDITIHADTISELFEELRDISVTGRGVLNQVEEESINNRNPVWSEDQSLLSVVETKHTKTLEDLFVAKLNSFYDDFTMLKTVAKSNNGYYSNFKGNGAIPGFIFKSSKDVHNFIEEVESKINESPESTSSNDALRLRKILDTELSENVDSVSEPNYIQYNLFNDDNSRIKARNEYNTFLESVGKANEKSTSNETQRNLQQEVENYLSRFKSADNTKWNRNNSRTHRAISVNQNGQETLIPKRNIVSFKESNFVDLVGKTVKSTADVVQLLKDQRSPRMEKFHYVIVDSKTNKVVYNDSVSDGKLGQASVDANLLTYILNIYLPQNTVYDVYLSHNHPSGVLVPSSPDIKLTQFIHDSITDISDHRLKAHIIFDGNKAIEFDIDGNQEFHSIDSPGYDSPFEGRYKISSPTDAIHLAKSVIDTIDSDEILVFYLNSQNKVIAHDYFSIDAPHEDLLNHIKHVSASQGGMHTLTISKQAENTLPNDIRLITKNSLDHIFVNENGRAEIKDYSTPLNYSLSLTDGFGNSSRIKIEEPQLAPNGKPSKLTSEQHKQVRTPEFKKWFGDWEKTARLKKLIGQTPVKLDYSKPEGSLPDFRRKTYKEALEIRGEYLNDDTGKKLNVVRNSINEVKNHTYTFDEVASLNFFPDFIKSAILIEAGVPNNKDNRTDIVSFDYYLTQTEINGTPYIVRIDVGQDEQGNLYYDHGLTEIKKGFQLSSGLITNQLATLSKAISKDTRLKALLQDNSSKVVDEENGEPMVVYHGTDGKFNTFALNTAKGWGKGVYFTDSKEASKEFGNNVVPAFLSIKNPLLASEISKLNNDFESNPIWKKHEAKLKEKYGDDYTLDFFNEIGESFTIANEVSRALGYDGIIAEDSNNINGLEIVAFNPNQIKSATENNGNFDVGNEDIRFKDLSGQAVSNEDLANNRLILTKNAKEFVKDWKNKPDFIFYTDVADFISSNEGTEYLKGEKFSGVFKDGKVHLILDSIKTIDNLEKTILHESIGHYGLRNFFNEYLAENGTKDEFNQLLDEIALSYMDDELFSKIAKNYHNKSVNELTIGQLREVAEEFVAHSAEQNPEASFLDKLIALIRRIIRKIPAMRNMNLNRAELLSLISMSKAFVLNENGTIGYNKYAKMYVLTKTPLVKNANAQDKLNYLKFKYPDFEDRMNIPIRFKTILDEEHEVRLRRESDLGSINEDPVIEYKRFDNAVRYWQDKMIDLKRLQETKQKQDGTVEDDSNPYMVEETHYGRVDALRKGFENKHVKPFIATMQLINKQSGLEYLDISEYLYAKFAPVRNEEIYSRNKELIDSKIELTLESIQSLRENIVALDAQILSSPEQEVAKLTEKKESIERKINWNERSVKQLEKKIEELNKSSSGMSDEESSEIVQNIRQKLNDDGLLDTLQAQVKDMTDFIAKTWFDSGLISDKRYQMMLEDNNYVPLRGFDEVIDSDETIFSGDMKALGRTSRAGDVIAYIMAMSDTAIIRAEKNKIMQSMVEFVKANPDPRAYKVNNTFFVNTGEIDSETGKQIFEALTKKPSKEDFDSGKAVKEINYEDVIIYWRNTDPKKTVRAYYGGKPTIITFNKPEIPNALSNVGVEKLPFFLKGASKAMRFLRNTYTQYSPEFSIRNFFRDSTEGFIHLTQDFNKFVALEIINPVRLGSIMRGMRQIIRNEDAKSEWAQWYQKFEDSGGRSGMWQLDSVVEHTKHLQKLVQRSSTKGMVPTTINSFNAFLEIVEDYNQIVENAVRLSTFRYLVEEKGYSKIKAASYAKNLTVNFNRKGNASSWAGTLYLFFNAGVQGISRLVKPFKSDNSSIRRKAALTPLIMAGSSFMWLELMRAVMGHGDDEEDYIDKQSSFMLTHNIMIPNILSDDENDFFKIPLPYGYNTYWTLGVLANQFAHGIKDLGESAMALGDVAMGSFSPIGGLDSEKPGVAFSKLASPTLLDPILELSMNENFAGSPIYREQTRFARQLPKSEVYYSSANKLFVEIAKNMNSITGGDMVQSGAIDVSPEVLEYMLSQVTGGTGQFFMKSVGFMSNLVEGDAFEGDRLRQIPFLSAMMTDTSPYAEVKRFYEEYDKLKSKHDTWRLYLEIDPKKANSYMEKNREDIVEYFKAKAVVSLFRDTRDIDNFIKQGKVGEGSSDGIKSATKKLVTDFNREKNRERKANSILD